MIKKGGRLGRIAEVVNMQTIYIPIGLPGCGKSTFFETRLKGKGIIKISADEIRFRKLDSENSHLYFDASIEKEVWEEYYNTLNIYLKHDASVYCDCTNLTLAKRMKIYESIIQNDCIVKIVYIFFDIHAQECWDNQKNRDRKVDLSILTEMDSILESINRIEENLFKSKLITIYSLDQIKTLQL